MSNPKIELESDGYGIYLPRAVWLLKQLAVGEMMLQLLLLVTHCGN